MRTLHTYIPGVCRPRPQKARDRRRLARLPAPSEPRGEPDGLFRRNRGRPSSAATRAAARSRAAYHWGLLAFLLLGGAQIFLAGLGVFRLDDQDVSGDVAFAPHRAVGFTMGGVALMILVLALIARPGTRLVILSAVLVVLAILVQSLLAGLP